MQVPLQIVFENIARSEILATRIRDRLRRIESLHPRLLRCQIAVSHARRHAQPVEVMIVLHVPGDELIVTQQGSVDTDQVIQEAFDKARRQLVEHARQSHGARATPALQPEHAHAAL